MRMGTLSILAAPLCRVRVLRTNLGGAEMRENNVPMRVSVSSVQNACVSRAMRES